MTRRMSFVAALLVAGAPLTLAQSPAQQSADKPDRVMQAMRDEMARSTKELRLDTLPRPYFIAYRVTEGDNVGASARLGGLLTTGNGRGSRYLQVELRVGDYAFDNTNYFGAGFLPSAYVGFGAISLDDDYQEIRRQLWLSTDRAYKQAVEALSQKRAALQTRTATEAVPDFSREPVTNTVEELPAPVVNRAALDSLARDLSAIFKATPEIYNSSVSVNAGYSRIRYLNSDGTSYVRARPSAGVSVQAFTQAGDGMPLADYFSASGRVTADLPARDTLIARTRALAAGLANLRATALADAYDGPVLFEGDAAGELLNTVLAPKLVGTRKPVTNPMYERVMQMQGGANDWLDLIGARVLPLFLSVVDDPTLSSVQGVKLQESARVDDEGVTVHPTKVIDRGILKTLLMTRVPVSGIERSTGSRRGNGAAPSHLIVSADSGLPADELRRKLLALASAQGRDYAIVVRRLTNPRLTAQADPSAMTMFRSSGGAPADPPIRALVAVKVYADGHEEPVRGAEITGLGAAALKSIVGVSKAQNIYSTVYFSTAGIFSGGGGSGLVTYVTPSLLFDNVSIRKPKGSNPRPPVVSPPF